MNFKTNKHQTAAESIRQYSVFLLLLSVVVFIGCNNAKTGKSEKNCNNIIVTDFRGKDITFDKPAQRIVCLIESALSGIYMLGAADKIVGISSNVYDENIVSQYAELDTRIKNKKIPAPGNWDFVNIESVIALKPDLVIMWSSQVESIQSLESKGIKVYGVMLKSTNDVYKEIIDFGKITGKEKRADSLIRYTKEELEKIDKTHENLIKEKKNVYFMWSQGPLETSGTNSTVNELITFAGAKNVCNSTEEHLVVNIEKIIDWNPEIIVMWNNANKDPDDIIKLSGWGNIKAIKEKKVFELPSVFYCDLWTLKFQFAVKLLSTWCYPDNYKNYDLEKEKQQMIYHLYGKKR